MANKDYNVYNNLDIHFVNYGELYKTPREMDMNSKELIGDYADALIKGSSDVYKNSPEMIGNRYFIDTQTQCLDKNDNSQVHNRSVLVDNINASAMSKAKDGNKGLIYSLLASMKSINSGAMFDSSNGEPISHTKYSSTGYLHNIEKKPMPYCTNVSVYTDDKKERDISGWITEEDRETIDPLAIREGMTTNSRMEGMTTNSRMEGMTAMMPTMVISGDQTGDEFMGAAQQQQIVLDEQAKATADVVQEEAQKASESAQNAVKKSQDAASAHGTSSANNMRNTVQSNISEQKKRSDDAKAAGLEIQLKKDTLKYLDDNKNLSIYDILKQLLNTTFQCGEDENNYRRVPYKCVEEIWKKHQIPDQGSSDAKRNDLCKGEQEKLDKPISPKKFFDAFIQLIKTNQNNTQNLNTLPSIPSKQICIIVEKKVFNLLSAFIKPKIEKIPTNIDGKDYKTMETLLNNAFRYDVAKTIVRYNDISVYGHCKTVRENGNNDKSDDCCSCESFTDRFLECPKQSVRVKWLDFGAWIYMFVLFLVLFYILFRVLVKTFRLE